MSDNWITATRRSEPLRFGPQTEKTRKPCSAAETVEAAYRQILKREADWPGCEPHLRALEGGTRTVRGVVRDLLQSEEWKMRFIDDHPLPEIVIGLYSCVLARAPDRTGWNDLMAWAARDNWDPVIDQFVSSVEYTDRFGEDTVPGQDCRYISTASSPVSAS